MGLKDINDSQTWDRVVKRLLSLTEEGKIEWVDWSDKISRPHAASPPFVCVYKEWRILVYRVAEKYYHDDESFDWEEDVTMELIESDGQIDWTLPKVPTRFRLLDRIQYEHANVKGLLEDLLGQTDDK